MASVTPGYTFTGTSDPITATKLNLLGQPTVTLGAGEVDSTALASGLTISSLTITADTPFIGSASTATYSAAITLTVTTGNTHLITCTDAVNFSVTPSAAGTAGQHMYIVFTTDGTGGNVVTYASPFKSLGTHTLTGASSKFTSHFISDGTNWCEVSRTAQLS